LGPLFGSPPIIPTPNVNGTAIPLSNLHIPASAARINTAASTPSTPTQTVSLQTEHDTPRANRDIAKKTSSDSDVDEAETVHAPSEGRASGSVYSVDTMLASAGTGSRSGSDSDEDEDEEEKDVGSHVRPTETKEQVKPESSKAEDPASSSSEDERGEADEEEDETDSNEADGGSELGDLSLDDDPNDGTVTPGGRSVRDRPGTPGLRRTSGALTESGTGTGGSTSSVNGGTTPRMSGASTPKMTVASAGTTTSNLNSRLQSLRNGLHSVSMSNIRATAAHHGFSAQQHSASSSDLHAAFKAKDVSQDSRGPTPYAKGAFGSAGPNPNLSVPRGRSTTPTPKQGGFASYATGTSANSFAAPNTTTSQRQSFSTTTAPSKPSFHTNRNTLKIRDWESSFS
ncbi:hypothetical protein FRC07_013287, partial [Ceratobasidium sp. 392]